MCDLINDLDDLFNLNILNTRQILVLKFRLKINGERKRTLEEIGQLFGVTPVRIGQIEGNALRKLRHPDIYKNLSDDIKYHIEHRKDKKH